MAHLGLERCVIMSKHLFVPALLFPQVLTKQLQALVEIQAHPLNFSKVAQIRQRDRVLGLQASVFCGACCLTAGIGPWKSPRDETVCKRRLYTMTISDETIRRRRNLIRPGSESICPRTNAFSYMAMFKLQSLRGAFLLMASSPV